MRTSLAAVTALTGSLILPFLMLGSAQAVTSAPDLKNVASSTHIGTVMPVRGGGGGGFVGGGGGHMGGMGGGMGGFAGRGVLPAVNSITVTSTTRTSSMTVTFITVASSTIASLSPVVPGGGATTTAMAVAAIGCAVRPLSPVVPIGGLAIKPVWATTEAAQSELSKTKQTLAQTALIMRALRRADFVGRPE